MTTRRAAGVTLVLFALLAGLVDRFSLVISSSLGKIMCGDRYMQPVNGVLGDGSCGFNADMYLSVFLVLVLISGVVLIVSPD